MVTQLNIKKSICSTILLCGTLLSTAGITNDIVVDTYTYRDYSNVTLSANYDESYVNAPFDRSRDRDITIIVADHREQKESPLKVSINDVPWWYFIFFT